VSGLWLISYVVIWILVVTLCLFMIGLLRQLGVLQLQFEHPPVSELGAKTPPLKDDGPAIGSPFPQVVGETINGFGTVALASQRRASRTLVMFMSPLCDSCQHMIGPLNALMDDPTQDLSATVILRGDEGRCRSFLSVFPLRLPAICDHDSSIHRGLNVHRAPLGLLYDEHGMLIRKGVARTDDDLQVLLGNMTASSTAQDDVYPPVAVPA